MPPLPLVLASAGALMLGPVLIAAARNRPRALQAVDAFVLVAIIGIAALHVFPETFEHAGVIAAMAACAGFATPSLLERLPSRQPRSRGALADVGVVALAVHAFVDGAALSVSHGPFLATATLLHRVPEGIVLWTLARTTRSRAHAAVLLCAVAALNAVGAIAGVHLASVLRTDGASVLQAFAMGTVVHVLLDGNEHRSSEATGAGPSPVVGALLGIVAVAAVTGLAPEHAPLADRSTSREFVDLFARSAPAVLAAVLLTIVLRAIARRTPSSVFASAIQAFAPGHSPHAPPPSALLVGVLAPIPLALTWSFFGAGLALARIGVGLLLFLVLFRKLNRPGQHDAASDVHVAEPASRAGLAVALGSAASVSIAPLLAPDGVASPLLPQLMALLAPFHAPDAVLANGNAQLATFGIVLVADATNIGLVGRNARRTGARTAFVLLVLMFAAAGFGLSLASTGTLAAGPGPSPTTIERVASALLASLVAWGLARRGHRALLDEVLGIGRHRHARTGASHA